MAYSGQVAECQFLATGFSGNGMTLGTFFAMLIRDLMTGKSRLWAELFAPNRKFVSGTLDYLLENQDFLTYFIKDRLRTADCILRFLWSNDIIWPIHDGASGSGVQLRESGDEALNALW
jgi:hypothetical protein